MGRHQPPTNRSFYLSVAASTLRFAIIVALVVGGVVVINEAFDVPSGPAGAIGDGGSTVTESPSQSPSETTSPTRPPASPTVEGTVIAVFNGTSVTGLAGDTLGELIEQFGYEQGQEPDDAPSEVPVTTIYFARNRDRVEAEYLAGEYFSELEVRVARLPAGEDVADGVQLAIYLGNDFAALRA